MSKGKRKQIRDTEQLMHRLEHLRIPPRMEGKVKNVGIKPKRKPKKRG